MKVLWIICSIHKTINLDLWINCLLSGAPLGWYFIIVSLLYYKLSYSVNCPIHETINLGLWINPTSHGVSDSVAPMAGGLRGPPKKSRKDSFLTHVAIKHLLLGILRGHMQKISQKSQNLSKISGFQYFAKLRFSISLINKKLT